VADFNIAFEITMGNEGPYDNDPDDVGGETYWGIARRYHPDWGGWKIIDEYKSKPNFPANLKDAVGLKDSAKVLYKTMYWNIFLGDSIPDQKIAEELFDTGVNMGNSEAIKFLQTSLNLLNRNQQNYPDIVVDGKFGPNTLNTLKKYLSWDKVDYLYKIMNILQGVHYINYMNQSPIQEKYCRGWLNRVDFIRK